MDKGKISLTNIRPARFSSYWYQDNTQLLIKEIKEATLHARESDVAESSVPTFMILPHSGLTYSKRAFSYLLTRHRATIKAAIILSPCHYAPFAPNALYKSNFDGYETPLGTLSSLPLKIDYPTIVDNFPFLGEHGVEMVLPFLAYKQEEQQQDIKVSMFLINHINSKERTKRLAIALLEAIESLPYSLDEIVVIASSDFTHYGKRFQHTPFEGSNDDVESLIKQADMRVIEDLIKGIHTQESTFPSTPCGYAAMSVVSEMALRCNKKGKLIEYYTSQEIMRSDDSVSYASIFF
ncbi:MAG: AmmeMemoRadiSam system protein B [Bacteroidales bacterium]|jgi:AmmeMemoRadiSam system protein B|nr:AmmeMemoRadiSam system protein B [Bacteroidales bacterium]